MNLMKKYCFTNSNKRYVDMGYLPALPKSKDNDCLKITLNKLLVFLVGLLMFLIILDGEIMKI